MATYAIGDVQGCFTALQNLLTAINFNPSTDRLWFTGDLVNRGANSLEVLRFVKSLKDRVICVLGNHDLHLLAVALGQQASSPKDTLTDILAAPDRNDLIEWLRRLPLLHHDANLGFTLVHAGLVPQWDLAKALALAHESELVLQGDQVKEFLAHMYGNEPDRWEDSLTGWPRYRFIINCFTRIRFCDLEGKLDMHSKSDLDQAAPGFLPWFQIPHRASKKLNIIFGHWAALYNQWHKVTLEPGIFPLDSGCVWGNELSALRLEDKKRFSVSCKDRC